MRPLRLWIGAVGLLATLAPRWMLRIHARVNLLGYRNVDAVEPTRPLVVLTRLGGLVALAVAWLVLGEEPLAEAVDEDEDGTRIEFV